MRKLHDGDYTVPVSSEYDKGYGVESASDEVVIYVLNGEIDEVIAYGMHFTTEEEVDWEPGLSDTECIELLEKHHPYVFSEYTTEELKDIEADKQLDLFYDK